MRFRTEVEGDTVLILRENGAVVGALYPERMGGNAAEDLILWTVSAMNKHEKMHGREGP